MKYLLFYLIVCLSTKSQSQITIKYNKGGCGSVTITDNRPDSAFSILKNMIYNGWITQSKDTVPTNPLVDGKCGVPKITIDTPRKHLDEVSVTTPPSYTSLPIIHRTDKERREEAKRIRKYLMKRWRESRP